MVCLVANFLFNSEKMGQEDVVYAAEGDLSSNVYLGTVMEFERAGYDLYEAAYRNRITLIMVEKANRVTSGSAPAPTVPAPEDQAVEPPVPQVQAVEPLPAPQVQVVHPLPAKFLLDANPLIAQAQEMEVPDSQEPPSHSQNPPIGDEGEKDALFDDVDDGLVG